MQVAPVDAAQTTKFTPYQKFIVAVLAFLQFTIILDFMILSPLGAILMPSLKISPKQFGMVVSVYAFSAGISGLLAGGFADKYDRKKLLMFFYTGFLVGTLLCALATTFHFLLIARMVTGLFGGVIGSIVFAITTDLFPLHMRGRVIGVVQTSFAASQVLGIPIGLYIATHLGWHWTFHLIVLIGLIAGVIIFMFMKPIDGHLKLQSDRNAFQHLTHTLSNPRYLQAFLTMALLATGGFMLMPFSSAFSVHNLGVDLEHLPMVYMVTGFCSILAGPLVGRLSDTIGKFKIFMFGSVLMMVMVAIYTRLGITPIGWVMVLNVIMFMGIQARMISSQALMSAIPAPASRGSFMAVSSSIQQMSGGVASIVAGFIVFEHTDGTIQRFDVLGEVVIAATLITVLLMYKIHQLVPETEEDAPVVGPSH